MSLKCSLETLEHLPATQSYEIIESPNKSILR
jgi:hypothetical protein